MTLRVETIVECRAEVARARRTGRRIGFVPTMGALHEGHLSLVDAARGKGEWVVLSIFVNPLQFGCGEDLERYPRDLDRDTQLAAGRGVELIFAPSVEEMIPRPLAARIGMEGIVDGLEGTARPGHFAGVLTIVTKLFNIVQPDVAVFGQKDAQQAAAVRRLVADLDFPIQVIVAPIVRDEDGVALSSRNAYLSDEDREHACSLYQSLKTARSRIRGGEREPREIERAMLEVLGETPGVDAEYAAVVDPNRFEPLERIDGPALGVVAARVGSTRLIDNLVLVPDGD